MKPRHALMVGFGLGVIAVLALGGIAGGQTVVELAGKVRLLKPSPTAPPPAASRLLTPASAPRLTSPSPIPPPNSPGPRAGAIMVLRPRKPRVDPFRWQHDDPAARRHEPGRQSRRHLALGRRHLEEPERGRPVPAQRRDGRLRLRPPGNRAVRRLWAGWTRARAVLRRHVDVGWPGLASARSRSQARPAYARGHGVRSSPGRGRDGWRRGREGVHLDLDMGWDRLDSASPDHQPHGAQARSEEHKSEL